MNEIFVKAEQLVSDVSEYVDNHVATAKLELAEKSSSIAATIIAAMVTGMVFSLFVLFTGFALAYALTSLTGKMSLSFLIVAAVYLVSGVIIWIAGKRIIQLPVLNALLQQLFKEDGKNQEP